ncbi:hypothetical protein ACFTWS_39665 [Streptomyces sp. NPDC057027]|uniref:hypothetical protein n=1 Tax=Streptomyces sp. NPDC057027 TaxID=3346004 RepID=UPI003641A102
MWFVSGVFVAALLLSAGAVGEPWLLDAGPGGKARIVKLEALAEWTQRLSEILRLGFALEQALVTSRKNPPAALSGSSESVCCPRARTPPWARKMM